MVGCVIVRNGRILGEGYHRKFGGPHAEVNALRDAARRGHKCAGADVYVTLEPCCHYGKTPPCAEALIAALVGARPVGRGLRRWGHRRHTLGRVFAAMKDPFPQVAGKGIARLRRAGIGVHLGLCAEQARALNAPFIKRITEGLPWVIAKWAQTIDGRIATSTGDSRWISSAESRRTVHALRARVDAIIVGIGTALADDPRLTVRGVPLRRPHPPRRIVIDPDLRLPEMSRLVQSLEAPLTIAVRAPLLRRAPSKLRRLKLRGVEFIGLPALPSDPKRLDLRPLLRHLAHAHGATNVLVEGGGRVFGSLLAQGLIDQALVYVAPKLLGDEQAVPSISGLRCPRMARSHQVILCSARRIGDDVLLDYRVSAPSRQRARAK
jgi:diaminohydroxyphosphoribosylaminopyrimidine deaminase/5-amino-6-(5-phosphoribosylamino)uracil reductase